MPDASYDAILFVSFGGPEGRDDVLPFLENVLRGRNVPRERMLAVAEHYYHFDGVSPINQQNRELIAAVTTRLRERGVMLPVYWGNRNWHPLLSDCMTQMTADGIQHAIAFVTASVSSYSSCRQYRQNVADARQTAGAAAPTVDKIRVFYNHPDFIAANSDRVRDAIARLPKSAQDGCQVFFTAHSIPYSMANACPYEQQLRESCRLVAEDLGLTADQWQLVYQSRSGRPEDPWLEPDVLDALRALPENSPSGVVLVPIGFLSDHMEVMYDLDIEAADLCAERHIPMQRAGTVGTHPRFVEMVCKLIEERVVPGMPREAIGTFGPNWDVCPENCCPAPMMRRPGPPSP
ncbi:ferrochelatase [Planctomicrobium piriforme]|uniref:Ferrochelatase n=1 Tax=Planctomicrobium piriforme TaxID=1576369 RepID=A0A1I3S6X4_9PLAN|nr:ferrochelatase [Planctomicrobium piriforme]SFJ54573.1 ferrochelatase [Planctomicrobium piriforme]